MHTPDAAQQILSEMAKQNFKKVNFWCVDEGCCPLPPPLIPIYGGTHGKNGPIFNGQSIYPHFIISSLELNVVPGVLEPYMSQGGQGVAETPMVWEGLSVTSGNLHLFLVPFCTNISIVFISCLIQSNSNNLVLPFSSVYSFLFSIFFLHPFLFLYIHLSVVD